MVPAASNTGTASPTPVVGTLPSRPSPLALGRRYAEAFYGGDSRSFWEALDPEMQRFHETPENIGSFAQAVRDRAGSNIRRVDDLVRSIDGKDVYLLHARGDAREFEIKIFLNPDGTIGGFEARMIKAAKLAPSRFLDYRTKTPLRLPFQGIWRVADGGRTLRDNYHARFREQRFAYDFVVSRDGQRHRRDGTRNEDWYCFGRPILAPGEGMVLSAVNTIPDNPPGINDAKNVLGNHVVIDHRNGEFSFLVHLQQGSVQVREGDAVVSGTPIGRCGNSGNSREPHLHYHMQNGADFEDGEGLPAQFLDYRAGYQRVVRGEPPKGQVIRPRQDTRPASH